MEKATSSPDGPLDPLSRIAMLVPHDPDEDPRIRWVASTCAELARTDVIGAVWSNTRPAVEYDTVVVIERRNIYDVSSTRARAAATLLAGGTLFGSARRYLDREGKPPARGLLRAVDHQLGAVARFASAGSYGNLLVSTLARAGLALSIAPKILICHDIYALLAAPAIKRKFGCFVVYDSHEFWPEADILARGWEIGFMTMLERRAIAHADAVVTVSPPLARHLEKIYGIESVICVPNAEPFDHTVTPSDPSSPDQPVRFLLQGQVAPGRGIEILMRAWADLDLHEAVLELRCPENAYLVQLRDRFAQAIGAGRIVIQPPVREADLVHAARTADVGVIPYVGPNLNHLYACPNKLSQYMHAGLAILANDLVFVGEVLRRYDCGAVYSADDPATLGVAVRALVDDRQRLNAMKRNSLAAFTSEFNWRVQAAPYRQLLADVLGGGSG